MKTYVVEHLDPELEAWSSLEYAAIAQESHDAGSKFLLSSVPPSLVLPPNLQSVEGLQVQSRGVEELFDKPQVCLLDPAAEQELSPDDGEVFSVFLFGGILGDDPPRGNALDTTCAMLWHISIYAKCDTDLQWLDRTSELRKKGYTGRRLGPVQMTTDTAVRVTRIIVEDKIPLDKIPYVDHPEIIINRHERTEMPFRYVKADDGQPIMPKGMVDLIKADAEKGLGDLL